MGLPLLRAPGLPRQSQEVVRGMLPSTPCWLRTAHSPRVFLSHRQGNRWRERSGRETDLPRVVWLPDRAVISAASLIHATRIGGIAVSLSTGGPERTYRRTRQSEAAWSPPSLPDRSGRLQSGWFDCRCGRCACEGGRRKGDEQALPAQTPYGEAPRQRPADRRSNGAGCSKPRPRRCPNGPAAIGLPSDASRNGKRDGRTEAW